MPGNLHSILLASDAAPAGGLIEPRLDMPLLVLDVPVADYVVGGFTISP
jgi:hypothetical protein